MASEHSFQGQPSFPRELKTIDLPKISLTKLSNGDQATETSLFDACCGLGFFILDLGDSDTGANVLGQNLMSEVDRLFELSQECFDLEYSEKMEYQHNMPEDLLGYKARGETKTDTGKPDRHEFFAMGMDEMQGGEPARANAPPIEANRPLIRSYLAHGREVLSLILRALERGLRLPADALQQLHRSDAPSGTKLRFLKYGRSSSDDDMYPSLIGHTDWGSVTLLANVLGGLQVLDPQADGTDDGWGWIRPEPGCMIVNMGDAMVEWTGGVLRSNLHRVTYSPGEQRFADRYSIALAFRPYKTAHMTRLKGGVIPTLEQDRQDNIYTSLGQIEVNAFDWEVEKGKAMFYGKEIAQSRGGRALISA